MKRLQMLYVTFGVVVGAIVGVIVTAAVARSGKSDTGSVQITEQHHDHSAHHGAGEVHGSRHREEPGMREYETAESRREGRVNMEQHHTGQGGSSDSAVPTPCVERHGAEGHEDDHNHEH
mgnify:CR=1 FL=1